MWDSLGVQEDSEAQSLLQSPCYVRLLQTSNLAESERSARGRSCLLLGAATGGGSVAFVASGMPAIPIASLEAAKEGGT